MTDAEIGNSVQALREMDHPRNGKNLAALEKALAGHSSVLPFVGAGLSIPLGFPGWTQFLKDEARNVHLEAEIEMHLNAGQYEEAAEKLRDKLGFRDFESALQAAFGDPREEKARLEEPAILTIPALTSGPVITTNFDRALEKVFIDAQAPFEDKVWGNAADFMTRALKDDSRLLLKMHGDILDRTNRVLTLTEYREHYGDGAQPDNSKPLPKLLRRLFESRPVLFVGCSLNKDRPLQVLKAAVNDTNMSHYAIVEHPGDAGDADERRRELSNCGITAILYPAGKHHHVTCLLRHLCALRAEGHVRPGSDSTKPSTKGRSQHETPAVSPVSARQSTETGKPKKGFWGNRGWSYEVHERFEENLGYYLVRIRPYNRDAARRDLERMLADHGLGTIRAYELFGTYDLMIRVWFPAALSKRFEALLVSYMHCQGVWAFAANADHKRWYTDEPLWDAARRRKLLADLNQKVIEEVENGKDPQFVELLEKNGLVVDHSTLDEKTIMFFVGVNFAEDLDVDMMNRAIKEITDHLTGNPKLSRIRVDRGLGFCEILIQAEASDFYTIGDVPTGIASRFQTSGAQTETYLSKRRLHIAGDGRIGSATFDAIAGKDIYVAELLPELYPKRKPLHDEIEIFLKDPRFRPSGPVARRFVHDFMLGVLSERMAGYSLISFQLFSEWERFLREKHREFLGRRGLNVTEVYSAVNVTGKSWEDFTLVDVLQIYSRALLGSPEILTIGTDWQQLTNIRNVVVHNRKELDDWRSIIQAVLVHWRRVGELICLVERETSSKFDGAYAEDCGKP